jgi:hypothetical protein
VKEKIKMEKLFTEKQLVEYGYGSRSKLSDDRMKGRGIPFVYVGTSVRYRESDIQKWLDANRVTHALQIPQRKNTGIASAKKRSACN